MQAYVTMSPEMNRAHTALAFARSHDWGSSAYLYRGMDGRMMIGGLRDWYTDVMGKPSCNVVDRPATMDAIREFGGY